MAFKSLEKILLLCVILAVILTLNIELTYFQNNDNEPGIHAPCKPKVEVISNFDLLSSEQLYEEWKSQQTATRERQIEIITQTTGIIITFTKKQVICTSNISVRKYCTL